MLVDFAIDLPGKQLQVRHCTEMLAAGTGDIAIRKDARVVAVAAWNGSIAMYHRHKWRLLALLQVRYGQLLFSISDALHEPPILHRVLIMRLMHMDELHASCLHI